MPIEGLAADRELAPDYPGISDSTDLSDWDPPFPLDLRRVRKVDEDYWDRYRGDEYRRFEVRPGITFTYLGLKTDAQARVYFGGAPSDNLFVAGEMMAGNVLGKGYTAGVGMSIGTAFGRIAGTNAARAVQGKEPIHAAA